MAIPAGTEPQPVDDFGRLPSAYKLAVLSDGRFYPMRFGRFFRDSHGAWLSYAYQDDAEQFCWFDQRARERGW